MDNKLLWSLMGMGALFLYLNRNARSSAENRAFYMPTIDKATADYGLPPGLLEKLIDTESAFRSDIISGDKVSSAGAVGIAQIIPKWHPDVNPLDPIASIDYAASYLSNLYREFGTWGLAVMAYNWGPGNLTKWLNNELTTVPGETQNYLLKITGQAVAGVVA